MCLTAARKFAQSACGVDINSRAIRFAEFNRQLNGIGGVSTYSGDLFEPVQSKVFDWIVAHPPYAPALVDSIACRDAGTDGERVSTDVIRELPHYLSDGGEFYGYLLLSDRRDAPAECRVRDMLGAEGKELDVALLVLSEWSAVAFVSDRAGASRGSKENEELIEACRKLGISKFLTTALTIRTRRGSSPSTLRHPAFGWQTVQTMADHL